MISVLLHYSVEATPLAVILYALTWWIMGKHNNQRHRLDRSWHVIGIITVAVGVGIVRLAAAFLLGGSSMQELWSNQGIGLVGPVGVPVVLSVGTAAFLGRKARALTISPDGIKPPA